MKNYFIIEGANATGKSTLIEGLKNRNQDIFVSYSIPEDFQILRKKEAISTLISGKALITLKSPTK